MSKFMLCITVIGVLLAAPLGMAQADEVPTIAILRFGRLFHTTTIYGLLDVLEAHGLVSAEERELLFAGQDLEGEKLTVFWGDSNFDYAYAQQLVEQALDRGADVLLTFSTAMTQLALNATIDLDEPPIILFTSVFNPYQAGIADSPCIKAEHITGTESRTPYDEVIALLLLQVPSVQSIGLIYNATEPSGLWGAQQIREQAEARGLTVEHEAVVGLSDLSSATETLVDKGVDAILLPVDTTTIRGFPLIASVATENGIPVIHSDPASVRSPVGPDFGAIFAAGTALYYHRGLNVGYVLAAYLKNEIDIADIGISILMDLDVAVNLDMLRMLGMEPADELIGKSAYVVENDGLAYPPNFLELTDERNMQTMRVVMELAQGRGTSMATELTEFARLIPVPDFVAERETYIESVACTPERVAEEQAQLDAARE